MTDQTIGTGRRGEAVELDSGVREMGRHKVQSPTSWTVLGMRLCVRKTNSVRTSRGLEGTGCEEDGDAGSEEGEEEDGGFMVEMVRGRGDERRHAETRTERGICSAWDVSEGRKGGRRLRMGGGWVRGDARSRGQDAFG